MHNLSIISIVSHFQAYVISLFMSLSLWVPLIWRFVECVCVLIKQLLWTLRNWRKATKHDTTWHNCRWRSCLSGFWLLLFFGCNNRRHRDVGGAPLHSACPISRFSPAVARYCCLFCFLSPFKVYFDFPNKWNTIINAIFKCPQTTFEYRLFYVGIGFGVSVSGLRRQLMRQHFKLPHTTNRYPARRIVDSSIEIFYFHAENV